MGDYHDLVTARQALVNIVRLTTGATEPRLQLVGVEAIRALRQIGVDLPTMAEVEDLALSLSDDPQ